MTTCSKIGSQQPRHFQSCAVFLKAVVLNNGQVTTQRHLWRYMWIHFFGKIVTDQWLGIYSCCWRLCTQRRPAHVSCISWILLHRSARYHYWGNSSRVNWCSQSLSSVPCYLRRAWHSAWWNLTSKATFSRSLSCINSGIWCPQRSMFLHHRI